MVVLTGFRVFLAKAVGGPAWAVVDYVALLVAEWSDDAGEHPVGDVIVWLVLLVAKRSGVPGRSFGVPS